MNCRSSRWLCWLSLLLGILAAASLSVDLAVAEYWQRIRLPSDLNKAIHLAESFGHSLGVAWVLLTVAVLDPQQRRKIVPLAVMTFGAGLSANLVKLLIVRWRPRRAEGLESVWQTFIGWRPTAALPDGLTKWNADAQSFPSAHSATAAGLAIGLTLLYPRGRWLFATGAVLACLQRTVAHAHFASDVFAGAALGCLWSAAVLQSRLITRSDAVKQTIS